MKRGVREGERKTYDDSWVVVLAGGEGSRIQDLSIDAAGKPAPKQYCRFGTQKTLLRRALERSFHLVPPERVLTVVAPHHKKWWKRELNDLPKGNILVQPSNRGTAAGVLLPLVEILTRDPDARVLFLPSDHYVEREEVLRRALEEALVLSYWREDQVLLLGITPERPDPQYGWIEHNAEEWDGIFQVERFREKPPLEEAQRLLAQGALWNSFMFHSSGRLLLHLFSKLLPALHPVLDWKFSSASGNNPEVALQAVYERLPAFDFSRDLLEKAGGHLHVYPVPHCGWSDLGTPERLIQFFQKISISSADFASKIAALPDLKPVTDGVSS